MEHGESASPPKGAPYSETSRGDFGAPVGNDGGEQESLDKRLDPTRQRASKARQKCTAEEKQSLLNARHQGTRAAFQQTNPKRPGKSRDRYEAYKSASNIEEAISKLGATMSDVQNDWLRGYLHVQGLQNPVQASVGPEKKINGKKAKRNGGGAGSFKGKKELRRERNERRAKFRDGEALLPPPVVRFDSSVRVVATIRHSIEENLLFAQRVPPDSDSALEESSSSSSAKPSSKKSWTAGLKRPLQNSTNKMDGAASGDTPTASTQVSLGFRMPLAPSRPQLVTMKSAAKAISHNAIGFLESPTGTGKTLGLMVAALECQRTIEDKVSREREEQQKLRTAQAQADEDDGGDQENQSWECTPRVVWVARTHDQLEHAVHEFKRLPYRPMMSLRLSRERYCAHPDVAVAPNRAEACEEVLSTPPSPIPASLQRPHAQFDPLAYTLSRRLRR